MKIFKFLGKALWAIVKTAIRMVVYYVVGQWFLEHLPWWKD